MKDKDGKTENRAEILEPDAEYLSRPPFDDDGDDAGWSADGFAGGAKDDAPGAEQSSFQKDDGEPHAAGETAGTPADEGKAPTEAAAIRYDAGAPAPVLSEIGEGERADAIVAMARELGVYIHRDERLLSELKRLREGEEIPKELYAVIAAVLSFSYLLQGKTPDSYKRSDGSTAVNTKA